jgi:transposase
MATAPRKLSPSDLMDEQWALLTMGLVLAVVVHSAKIQDRDGAKLVFTWAQLKGPGRRMQRVWADGGYSGKLIAWVTGLCRWVLEIVKRGDEVKGFQLPQRWVVERTFSLLGRASSGRAMTLQTGWVTRSPRTTKTWP